MNESAKEARREYLKEWRKKNRDKWNAYQKKWRKNNPDKCNEYQTRYWEKKAAKAAAENTPE